MRVGLSAKIIVAALNNIFPPTKTVCTQINPTQVVCKEMPQ